MNISDLRNGEKKVIEKNIKGDSSTYVLEIDRTEEGNLFYSSFCKNSKGEEINGSLTVNQRLNKESKLWYGVK